MYKVLETYRRFDQKNNMVCRPYWEPSLRHLSKQRSEIPLQRMASGITGFERMDYALVTSSSVLVSTFGTGINTPNAGLKLWEPLPLAGSLKFPEEKYAVTDAAKMAEQIKRVAQHLGADLVGIADLDMRWVYSHHYIPESDESKPVEIDERYKYVIVMAVEMDYDMMKTAPTALEWAEVRLAYSKMAFLVCAMAEFIRQLGYGAIPSLNDTALNVPLAIDAGLGQLGRHGLLISPQFGPRQRICKVITDLPLKSGEPRDFGVTDFCSVCHKCARECPSQAISHGEMTADVSSISNNPGVMKWPLSSEKCRQYWNKIGGTNCGICIRVCPFNKPKGWIHNVSRWTVKHAAPVDPLMVRMDDIIGYGKYLDPTFFWHNSG